MAKLKNNKVTKDDLIEYLASSSDFSFELSVLKMLRGYQINCEHGGLYEDPVTGKAREFDIRATKTISKYRVRLAVECKNIRDYFPLLVSCIPRLEEESYHQVAFVGEPKSFEYLGIPKFQQSRAKALSIVGEHSIYKTNQPVGKSTAQVGRNQDGTISVNDAELYDKWSQSLSSAVDLVTRAYWDGDENDEKDSYLSAVFPIVVVPNDRLWSVLYDDDGNRIQDPCLTDRCSCFVDKDYEMGTKIAGTRIWISHIEIMTLNGLRSFVESHLKDETGILELFSNEGISEAFERELENRT
ncbi:MAG: hypothetical protein WDA26_12595 [Pusillimonas sp.]|jgi:hypothetical protein